MKRGVACLALLTAGSYAHGMSWADLWSRPDQQTLAQRQQAYAEIQGRQYAAAAQHLQPYTDPASQYNRGNALAHAGDLQAALSAYDAVLHDAAAGEDLQRDARHNRDLVEQQIKSQPQADKKNAKDSQRGEDNQDSNSTRDDKSGKDGKSAEDNSGAKDNRNTNDDKSTKDDKSAKDDAASAGNRNPADGKLSDGDKAGRSDTAQQATQAPPPPASPRSGPAAEGQPNPADLRPGEAPPPPQTEQTQSLDQWLRWIPDDPAGLLRRKFMIEHMRSQGGAQQ
jgi:Ca-activated chloride channel family protein